MEWGGGGEFCTWELAEEGAVGGARSMGEELGHFGGGGVGGLCFWLSTWDLVFGFRVEMEMVDGVHVIL